MHAEGKADRSPASQPPQPSRHAPARRRNGLRSARKGLWLFAVYVALYAGFIALSTFRHDLMAREALGGVNVAILYGAGLIVAALMLSLMHVALRRDDEAEQRREGP